MSRLDVAMFNAVLRESAEEMPTDPVSDPISDSKVLPIPAGKSSFGSGAQLKNAVRTFISLSSFTTLISSFFHYVLTSLILVSVLFLVLSVYLRIRAKVTVENLSIVKYLFYWIAGPCFSSMQDDHSLKTFFLPYH